MKVINLLPQSEQKSIRQEKLFSSFRKFLLASAMTYALVIAGVVGWKFYLQSTLVGVDADIKKNQAFIDKQENDNIRKEAQKNNNTVTDYITLAKANPNWSNVLIELSRLVPSDVVLTSLAANTKTGKIELLGVGLTRDAVLKLRSNIAGSSTFKNINLPLENLQKPTNVVFSYAFYLADGALKK
jgi:Tfp pilus assembly protein PilN